MLLTFWLGFFLGVLIETLCTLHREHKQQGRTRSIIILLRPLGDRMANVLSAAVGTVVNAVVQPLQKDGVTPSQGVVSGATFTASDLTVASFVTNTDQSASFTLLKIGVETVNVTATVTDPDGTVNQFTGTATITVTAGVGDVLTASITINLTAVPATPAS